MTEKETIFLTLDEALEALRIDLNQYAPQNYLLCELIRLMADDPLAVKSEAGGNGAWIRLAGCRQMRWVQGRELTEIACGMLPELRAHPRLMAAVCSRVFQARAVCAGEPGTGKPGIRIETGMEHFRCVQCGQCCRSLNYRDALTADDVSAWEKAGRQDILRWVGRFKRPDGRTAYRIWMTPGTGRPAAICPFLQRRSSENRWICRIHDVKPGICRQYPVSRKHAVMTGCPGFRKS